ncbi:MAG: DnaJ C-terminal domain-containing protein [Clostridia bacterium]
MSVEYKDYYKILGIDKNASPADLQKAYKKLAKKYHPDLNKSPEAEAKFKELNEANEVLKDPEKRTRYDQLGSNWQAGANQGDFGGFQGGFSGGSFGGSGFSDFFESLFGNGSSYGASGQGRGYTSTNQTRGFDFGGFGGQQQQAPPRDMSADIAISFLEAYHGTSRTLSVNNSEIEVKIPAGTKDGRKIKLRSKNSKQGDIHIQVTVHPSHTYRLENDDIYLTFHLSPWEAMLGVKLEVATLDGKLSLSFPPGTQTGQKFRIRGKGWPKKSGLGDFYVVTKIVVPKELSPEEHALIEQLASISTFAPRR